MSASSATSAPRWFIVVNLLSAIGFGLLSMTLCLPSMHEWSELLNAPQADVQLTFSAFVVAFGIAQVVYGPLSDLYGRKRMLVIGFSIAILASLAAAWASGIWWLVIARFCQGAGAAAGLVIGRAMVQDFFAASDRARIMAYIGMAMGLCPPLGTIVGGQVHVVFGWRANFLIAAAVAVIILALVVLCLPGGRPERSQNHWLKEIATAYGVLMRERLYVGFVAILSMCTGTFYVFLAGAPSVLAGYGVGPAEIGWYIMFIPLSYIVGSFLTSRLLRYIPENRLMTLGLSSSLTGTLLVLALALA
ncbi:MAG: MFS transporter, partial [Pseudomonadota bacterium]